MMSPDRARTTMRWGDAPSGAPRSHPLTTSAPIRAQRGDRREPVRYKRKPPTAAGFGRLRERLQTDAPCAPDCGFSRHMSRCEPRASTRPRDPSNPRNSLQGRRSWTDELTETGGSLFTWPQGSLFCLPFPPPAAGTSGARRVTPAPWPLAAMPSTSACAPPRLGAVPPSSSASAW